MNVKQQQEVTHIMRTELDRIAENEYACREGYKEGEAAGMEKGMEELSRQLIKLGVPAGCLGKGTRTNTPPLCAWGTQYALILRGRPFFIGRKIVHL